MTDRPILFNGPMVNAILEGRKTQTRRVLKPQPFTAPLAEGESYVSLGEFQGNCRRGLLKNVPVVGDRLYVREAWRSLNGLDHLSPSAMGAAAIEAGYKTPWGPVKYIADGSFLDWDDWHRCDPSFGTVEGKFRQGMHMPRWASRLTLVVTDVRVQRLQEINSDDAMAEGVELDLQCCGNPEIEYDLSDHGEPINPRQGACCGNPVLGSDPRDAFQALWDSINDARGFGWDANPWVVAVTFETHKCNIDQMVAG